LITRSGLSNQYIVWDGKLTLLEQKEDVAGLTW
jgi:hypothetical protein